VRFCPAPSSSPGIRLRVSWLAGARSTSRHH
jgi:hypothetical protein